MLSSLPRQSCKLVVLVNALSSSLVRLQPVDLDAITEVERQSTR